jgi:DNA modification methylase
MERGKRKDILPEDVTRLVARVGTDDRQNGAATNGGRYCTCGAWRGVLGLEPTPELYVQHLVEIFREVRRVLRADGTCWVNLGDSYATTPPGKCVDPFKTSGLAGINGASYRADRTALRANNQGKVYGDLKPKDLVGIPWRVAFALQADGWWLRSDIIWAKPNPMPESITDRPTKSHEYLFLLTKAARYYYDGEAIKEPSLHAGRVIEYDGTQKNCLAGDAANDRRTLIGSNGVRTLTVEPARNRRSVWTIATEPYPEAHFATFPEKLVEPCILAGTSERGACPTCGAPWGRKVERERPPADVFTKRHALSDGFVYNGSIHEGEWKGHGQKLQDWLNAHPPQTLGWSPTCACPPAEPVPCRVLDPFAGSGTTVAVAERLGRVGIGVELKAAYLRLAWARTRQTVLL